MILKEEFINEVKIKSQSIIGNDNDLLFKDISNKISDDYYFKYAFNDYFFKIATCNNFHYKPLCNEIRLGNINFANQLLKPKILFTYYSENIVVKIEERIDSVPLANKRDDFSTRIDCDKTKLIEKIKLISEVKLESDIKFPRFNRKVKIFKYIDECADLLNPTIIQKCLKIADYSVEDNLVFSHGDLIPGNILVSGDDFIFVDWEWVGFRSKTYDLVMFLLFSNIPNQILLDFNNYFIDDNLLFSAYMDAVLISFHEIKNWKNEKIFTDYKDNMINMWRLTLQLALDLIENF